MGELMLLKGHVGVKGINIDWSRGGVRGSILVW